MPRDLHRVRAPYTGPPPWLSPATACALEDSPRYRDRVTFVLACMGALLAAQCDAAQAAAVTGNACNEAANGPSCWWGNAGGWKITRAYAEAFQREHGTPAPWWYAAGNIASGDDDWCFYRVFASLEEFLREWLEHFVPKPTATHPPYPGYRETGRLFWTGGEWFPALIRVGYKGAVTKAHPAGSILEHRSLTHTCLAIWGQHVLNERSDPDAAPLVVDGSWGPKSCAACVAYQARNDLATSGEIDGPTLAALRRDALGTCNCPH